MTIEARLIAEIEDFHQKTGVKYCQLAHRMRMSDSDLNKILKGRKKMTIERAKAFADFLGYEITIRPANSKPAKDIGGSE